jgi:zinc transporter
MQAFVYADGKAAQLPFSEGCTQFTQANFVWLQLDGREEGARAWVSAAQDIPEIARAALLASETRPRSDLIGQGAIINLRGLGKTPEDDPDLLVSMRFWAEEGRVISLGFRSSIALDEVIETFLGGTITDPGDLLSAFSGAITDGLDPDVAGLGDTLDDIETDLETKGIWTMRRKVGRVRAQAIDYRRFVAPQRSALERLATANVDWLDEDDRLHLREASDRFARMAEELEAVRERAAIVHEELTDLRAEQMDGRSLLISIAALVFLPLTFITGVFGMNFKVMPWLDSDWGFWAVMAICLAITLFGIIWFFRHRWISRDGLGD